jgi:broad specificity phosphatase PhoE
MTAIVLVRHGETVWHADNRYAGSSDVPLTPAGIGQAERLARWARGAGLAAIYSSPLSRAGETAAAVARATGLEPRRDERLRELDFGEAEGLTTADMEAAFPAALRAFRGDPSAHHLPDGEDPQRAADRGVACLREIAAAHPAGRVLVVAHSTLKRLVLCRLLGIPLSEYRRVFPSVGNCALTEIRLKDEEVSLLEFNTPVDLLPVP